MQQAWLVLHSIFIALRADLAKVNSVISSFSVYIDQNFQNNFEEVKKSKFTTLDNNPKLVHGYGLLRLYDWQVSM